MAKPTLPPAAPAAKKKSIFSGLFSSKKSSTKPEKGKQAPATASAPAPAPPVKSNPTAPAPTSAVTPSKPISPSPPPPPSTAAKVKPVPVSSRVAQISDIPIGLFPVNVAKKESEFKPPETIDYIKNTTDLVYYHTVLAKATTIAEASSSTPPPAPVPPAKGNGSLLPPPPPPPPLPTLTPDQLEWVQEMDNNPLEKEYLHQMLDWMIARYILDPSKNPEAIREIVLLGPVLNKNQYRKLLNRFLIQFKESTILDPELVRALTQLIQDAGIGYLNFDDLTDILTEIRNREEHHKADEYLFYLTTSITKVLNAMVDDKVDGKPVYLDRVKEHEPTLQLLSSLRNKKGGDPFLKFQALYAYQAMQWIPNGESNTQRNLRHFIGVVGGLVKVSGVIQLDFQGFLGGLKEIQKEVSDIYDAVSSGWEDGHSLIENGKEMYKDLKIGLGLSKPRMWYVTLRGAERLVRWGQLADFNELVSTAPCRGDPLFLWGVCQLLGDIAMDSAWRRETRAQAIEFLGELFTSIDNSVPHRAVQNWVLTILKTISEIPVSSSSGNADEEEIKDQADVLGRKLKTDGNTLLPFFYPLKTQLPHPKSSSLLRKITEEPDLDLVVSRLRKCRLQEYEWEYKDDSVFVDPLAKPNLQASEDRDKVVPLSERVSEFLDPNQKSKATSPVLLILGDSGSGKSRFNRKLEYDLWREYKTGNPIPLFVDLKSITKLNQDLIQQHLQGLTDVRFEEKHLKELMQERRPLIMICDGYDECDSWPNLYYGNKMGPHIKMIVTCRSQYMTPTSNYRTYFEPLINPYESKRLQRGVSVNALVEAVIIPFMKDQIENYVDQYTKKIPSDDDSLASNQLTPWTKKQYMAQFEEVTHLLELVKNPFLLRLMLETLPSIAHTRQDLSVITRVLLYDEYVVQHFRKEFYRLTAQEPKMSPAKLDAFREVGGSFVKNEMDFSIDLADSIFREQNGVNYVEYSTSVNNKKASWKDAFFSPKPSIRLKRESCPLTSSKVGTPQDDQIKDQRPLGPSKSSKIILTDAYQFNHRSIMEYFFSCLMFSPEFSPDLNMYDDMEMAPTLGLTELLDPLAAASRPSSSSSSTDPPTSLADHPFGRQDLAKEPSIVSFLAERVQQNEKFRQQLETIIQLSKSNERVGRGAANAITILVRAGVRFNGEDLRGIKIQGADLSFGQFDSAQLQEADLRNTTLRNVWMRQADLTEANLEGADFGEWPYLQQDAIVRCCLYSPDDQTSAIGLASGVINVYNTTTWTKIHTLIGHTDTIPSVDYSPDSKQIVSASVDKTVRLWDVESGDSVFVMEGHSDGVRCVAYPSTGFHIASGSTDKTVRLWDTATGTHIYTYGGHSESVTAVAYSHDGLQIASGSVDKTVRLWDAQTGETMFVMTGHVSAVWSLIYSPDDLQVVSGGADRTVRLWDTRIGTVNHVLKGHTSGVTSITYIPERQQIVTGGVDKTVRLWHSQTGVPGTVFSGHDKSVWGVAYSPTSQHIISCSQDMTVRLWDVQGIASGPISTSHGLDVTSVTFSSDGRQIASSSLDKTVRLWNTETGAPGHVLQGFTDAVKCVALSPNGKQMVAGFTNSTARLWDTETNELTAILEGHSDSIWDAVFSPTGHQIASGSRDTTVRLWDAFTGEPGLVLSGHTDTVASVRYSPTGHQILSAGADNLVKLWDVQTGKATQTLEGHTARLWAAVYSPDGHQIASGSSDKTLRFWDAETGATGHVLRGHKDEVRVLAYSPDGLQIASGSWDKTVRLWDVDSGECLMVIEDFFGPVRGIGWKTTPFGTFIVTGSEDRLVALWRVLEDRGVYEARLRWSSTHNRLVLKNTSIKDVQGLSEINRQLLLQRGVTTDIPV